MVHGSGEMAAPLLDDPAGAIRAVNMRDPAPTRGLAVRGAFALPNGHPFTDDDIDLKRHGRGLLKHRGALTAAKERYMLELRGICGPYPSDRYRDPVGVERRQVRDALVATDYVRCMEKNPCT